LSSDFRAVADSILAQKGLEFAPNWILSLPTVNELTQTPMISRLPLAQGPTRYELLLTVGLPLG
jgi:hypothetical protein